MSTLARPVWGTATVVDSRPVADRIRRITLRRADGAPGRRAAPGCHVDVRVRTPLGPAVRSYSVVGSEAAGSLVTLSVLLTTASRGGSEHMHRLRVGDAIECTQPLQNFELRPGAARYVLLAGGVGITALVEAGRTLRRLGQDYRLVYVGRNRSAMAYVDELEAEHGARLELHVDDEGSPLDVDALVAALPDGPGRTEVYLCGPIRLMDAVRRSWVARDRPIADLRYETFGSSGWFEAEAFEVSVPELGIATTVPPDRTLLESLVAAGAELMWDCRKGECGLCEVRIGEVDGQVDHRDVFLSEGQKSEDASLCICVSRVAAPVGAAAGTGRISLVL